MQAGSDYEIHHVRGARGYYTDFGKKPLGGGLELWQGLFQFVKPLLLSGFVLIVLNHIGVLVLLLETC